ncbi:MAG: transcription termination factor Rho [Phycisphaeraceae bacterium]|nr:transcription termination factor Rho [Phycisphaerales bacterium]MCB9860040.1 transcription termination factor Rho [Phycisphaeraceae bacterium]
MIQSKTNAGATSVDFDVADEMSTETIIGIVDSPTPTESRLRQLSNGSLVVSPDDPWIPTSLVNEFHLRPGVEITTTVSMSKPKRRRRGGKRPARAEVSRIVEIEGQDPAIYAEHPAFEDLTSIDPQPRLTLEYPGCPVSCRLIDLFCPIGRGQRGLIVAPPKAGKTTLLKDIATSVLLNHKDIYVIVMLVDERPEEVTDFRRTLCGTAKELAEGTWSKPWDKDRIQVLASSNDHDIDKHIAISTMCMNRCKRMVEAGKHVVVVLDSLTRLGRAFNRSRKHASSGRTLTGGLDSKALEIPKQIFGSARNTEEAGSLTMIATCLVDTGSQGDQVIFEEFKGTGNMELVLDRKVAERRLFPAMDLAGSGTRKEDLLLDPTELKTMTALRRRLMAMPTPQQVEQLLAAMERFKTNANLVGLED